MQEEVNEVSGKLQQTIENLEEKPVNTVDKSILQGLVDRVEGTDSTKYIPSAWTAFANALEAALDKCMLEEKKLVVTGRSDGCTCSEFGDYVMETITEMTK